MEMGGRMWNVLGKRDNLIHLFLGCSFVALSIRSYGQQKDIDALQAEKDALQSMNKAMKKAMWDWKQQLFQEASDHPTSFPVPISRLKSIYGDNLSQKGVTGETVTADSTSSTPKFVV